MPTRQNPADEAARRAKYQMDQVVRDLRARRLMAGLSLSAVAAALGCSRQLVAKWEQRALAPSPIRLAAWGATLGLDISIRAFDAGSPLRDAGQLRLLGRGRHAVGTRWAWRTEVPVTSNPLDRRAIDAVLTAPRGRVGLEAITRLVDAQAQVGAALLKQEASGVDSHDPGPGRQPTQPGCGGRGCGNPASGVRTRDAGSSSGVAPRRAAEHKRHDPGLSAPSVTWPPRLGVALRQPGFCRASIGVTSAARAPPKIAV